MSRKSSVSLLQEYCAKNNIPAPIYDFITSVDGGFTCNVRFMDVEEYGNGRSKRDAKHNAAANLAKRLRLADSINDVAVKFDTGEMPLTDMIILLRDYCVQHKYPLPEIEIVNQAGTPDAPLFTAACSIASIKRYAESENKKDAKQKAAYRMLSVITSCDDVSLDTQLATSTTQTESDESKYYKHFRSYRELKEDAGCQTIGVLLSERHNYFKNFYDELKSTALNVIDTKYDNVEKQAFDVLKALKLEHVLSEIPTIKEGDNFTVIKLNCEYEVIFCAKQDKIYQEIVNYFKVMLQ
ncbi:uncharacterized protein LOC119684529 [Teleopsis dalmanni]|uniref:uncharacterized protein LOC119684529 n=1 Tax=Teleopsis dalmanni TaxID=139649 RepID=UPI0018CFAB7C|nr:uncharacterized protein LOC119684529 [Teleopsis dalmanni]